MFEVGRGHFVDGLMDSLEVVAFFDKMRLFFELSKGVEDQAWQGVLGSFLKGLLQHFLRSDVGRHGLGET